MRDEEYYIKKQRKKWERKYAEKMNKKASRIISWLRDKESIASISELGNYKTEIVDSGGQSYIRIYDEKGNLVDEGHFVYQQTDYVYVIRGSVIKKYKLENGRLKLLGVVAGNRVEYCDEEPYKSHIKYNDKEDEG